MNADLHPFSSHSSQRTQRERAHAAAPAWLPRYGCPVAQSIIALTFLAAQVATAQTIQFRPAELLRSAGATLDVGDYAIPCVADWNGDGRKDLLVGFRNADKVALFLNNGSDASPVFTGSVNLQAAGSDIVHLSSGCGAPAPFVCDYDADGKQDLLVGSGADGYVHFYRNTNNNAVPILDAGVRLTVSGSPLTVGLRATPVIWDWDKDGLKDLLCGSGDGSVYFFKNIGTSQSPAYSPSTRLQAGGADLNLGIRSVIRFHDLDEDGVIDLVGSSNDGVYWCRNMAREGIPLLASRTSLRGPVAAGGLAAIYTGIRMRLDLVDWDNDGVTDLLVGNWDGTVTLFPGYRFVFTSTLAGANGQCVFQWSSAPFLKYHLLSGTSPEAVTNVVFSNFASAGNTTVWTNSPAGDRGFYRAQIAP
jgi:hypothetical protein